MKKPPVIVIVGPTASGKSDAAVLLAKKINGAVISADSRQIYKGLDIGSGKVTKKEMRGIPHFCLDLVSPKTTLTAAHFIRYASQALKTIDAQGKVPILCGGTGFYIDTLLGRTPVSSVPADSMLRTSLSRKTVSTLVTMLKKLNPKRIDTIDLHNKVRLVRAIEIALHEKKHEKDTTTYHTALSDRTIIWVGIKKGKSDLDALIEKRLTKRWKGVLQETKRLHLRGISWKRLYDLGLEYRYASIALRELLPRDQAYHELLTSIRHYAKRQMTWFKKNKNIQWATSSKEAAHIAQQAYKKTDF